MESVRPYLLVFVGAGLGGMARLALNSAVPKIFGSDDPWATPLINVTGSVIMGFLVGWLAFKTSAGWSPSMRLFAATGILGGYTTFSTFSLETVLLMERHAYGQALAYVLGSVLLGVFGLWAALALTRSL